MALDNNNFETDPSPAVRINKYLSACGLCSRREADRLIESGQILINGIRASAGQKVFPEDKVTLADGQELTLYDKLILIAYNKPRGIECTSDKDTKNNIYDAINYPERIFPIGRLDKNSSGLILLTNDGSISDKILRSSNYHEKEYEVVTDKAISDDFLDKMRNGVRIVLDDDAHLRKIKAANGQASGRRRHTEVQAAACETAEKSRGIVVKTRPCKVTKTGEKNFNIVLTQGLNKQIRRMCGALGYKVVSLKRIRIMNIYLGDLKEGTYRDLTEEEISELKRLLK